MSDSILASTSPSMQAYESEWKLIGSKSNTGSTAEIPSGWLTFLSGSYSHTGLTYIRMRAKINKTISSDQPLYLNFDLNPVISEDVRIYSFSAGTTFVSPIYFCSPMHGTSSDSLIPWFTVSTIYDGKISQLTNNTGTPSHIFSLCNIAESGYNYASVSCSKGALTLEIYGKYMSF